MHGQEHQGEHSLIRLLALIHLPEKKFRRIKGYQEIRLLKERLVACLKFS
jgi:hypothetical protein